MFWYVLFRDSQVGTRRATAKVFRIESSSAWAMYTARRSAILRGRRHSDEFPRVLPNLGEELDPRRLADSMSPSEPERALQTLEVCPESCYPNEEQLVRDPKGRFTKGSHAAIEDGAEPRHVIWRYIYLAFMFLDMHVSLSYFVT